MSFICIGNPPIAGCGKILSEEEKEFYSNSCEECMRKWNQAIDDWKAGGENKELDRMFDSKSTSH